MCMCRVQKRIDLSLNIAYIHYYLFFFFKKMESRVLLQVLLVIFSLHTAAEGKHITKVKSTTIILSFSYKILFTLLFRFLSFNSLHNSG